MRNVRQLSFEEFAGNFAELLEYVRAEQVPLLVEYASGEKLLIKPYTSAQQNARSDAQDAENQTQSLPTQSSDQENISTAGAVYDLDPDSITPG